MGKRVFIVLHNAPKCSNNSCENVTAFRSIIAWFKQLLWHFELAWHTIIHVAAIFPPDSELQYPLSRCVWLPRLGSKLVHLSLVHWRCHFNQLFCPRRTVHWVHVRCGAANTWNALNLSIVHLDQMRNICHERAPAPILIVQKHELGKVLYPLKGIQLSNHIYQKSFL